MPIEEVFFVRTKHFSHILTIILTVFTFFCDSKQEAVNFLTKSASE